MSRWSLGVDGKKSFCGWRSPVFMTRSHTTHATLKSSLCQPHLNYSAEDFNFIQILDLTD
ncbi:MAG: hypothetical protein KME59_24045 [Trichormus sp. ATA11-4-KO1]|nr:hypothetical protein [Trichormus sp. ATA11-4-KO1]